MAYPERIKDNGRIAQSPYRLPFTCGRFCGVRRSVRYENLFYTRFFGSAGLCRNGSWSGIVATGRSIRREGSKGLETEKLRSADLADRSTASKSRSAAPAPQ